MEIRSHRELLFPLVLVAAASVNAQERKLTQSQLPAPVIATVTKEAQGATIKGYSTEIDHGKRVYEAETVLNGRTRDLQIAPDGKLTEVEEEIPMKLLPINVSSALNSRANGATIIKVESLTKKGRLVAYEASTEKAGHKGEIQVGPTGEKLHHEE